VEGICALIDACFEVDGGYRIAASELLAELDLPDGDPVEDTLIGVTPAGQIVALGWAIAPAGATATFRIFDWNYVHPGFRGLGIGSFLLDWWEQRGRTLTIASQLPGSLRQYPYDWQTDRIELLANHGYRPERHFIELERDLAAPVPKPALPSGIRIEPWEPAMLEPARHISNAAFADHWGSEPFEPERWASWHDEFFHHSASAMAFAGEEPVALIMCAVYPHDFEDRGRSEGWIERLGTLQASRGRGLASALVNRAMQVFRHDELDYALLGVDADSPTGAMSMYERLGFTALRQSIAYVKQIEV
jgi:GNAT superfamily N-acetyltransferase